jgi:anti-sigma regulatory factor (Ser/Thr protein kinase)
MTGPQQDEPTIIRITSETENLAQVRAAVQSAAQKCGFAPPDTESIVLAVGEAITNVIQHGYHGEPGQPIEITMEHVRKEQACGLQVTICDCGRQVPVEQIAGRDLDDVQPGGLGTHIIRTIMDEVEYAPRRPEGMQLRLFKMKS